ncbi:MAG: hypothetical protein ABIK68_15900 [bacterium]
MNRKIPLVQPMTYSTRIFILLFCVLYWAMPVSAQQTKTYRSTAKTPILENDIAFAKTNAFRQAQQNVIFAAIQDLLEPQIFAEYQKQILHRQSLQPRNHLISVKILNETSEGDEYKIELEAKVQINTLRDSLKQMDLIFRDDPWIPITLLVEDTLDIPADLLATKLANFHLKIEPLKKVNFNGISTGERMAKVFIEDLFLNYPQNRIIFILETTDGDLQRTSTSLPEKDLSADMSDQEQTQQSIGSVRGILLRILRKSDLEEVNRLSLNVPPPSQKNPESYKEVLQDSMSRLISLLTIQSIKRNTYEIGQDSSYYIEVAGLNAPYLRSAFELRVLKENLSISSYSLIQLSMDQCRYVINSNSDLKTLIAELQKVNPYFELLVEDSEFNTIRISAFYHYTPTATEPSSWIPDEKTLEKIKESILENTTLPATDDTGDKQTQERNSSKEKLNIFYIPTLIEKEPNNSSIQFNRIPPATYTIGEISNRADEDIYQMKGVEFSDVQLENVLFPSKLNKLDIKQANRAESADGGETADAALPEKLNRKATIYIDWIQLGKTSLSPQIKLYDENFNFIIAFNLIHTQKRLRFRYTFSEQLPEKVYARISDRIGFIQGETGGFKQYQYLIRYSWTDEKDKEPESPVISVSH